MINTNDRYKQKPVIFLAFANDEIDGLGYLRSLPEELRGTNEALEKAERDGLCEVVIRSNLTREDLFNVFLNPRYNKRIAIFHYGGHANSYHLLLESPDGSPTPAYREGLVSFLARQESLKLVFLNGCSTEAHAIQLKNAGIPFVIGTSRSIRDKVATDLAIRFYSSISIGATIERAWDDAQDFIKIQKGGTNFNNYCQYAPDIPIDRFPWTAIYKEGAEIVKKWNLPEAANDPLFGIEALPERKLPETPFLYLNRYQKKHAEIFFGRSHYIRKLYDRVTGGKTSSPVILLFGQSGVGKSSLLEAALLPRLANSHEVYYIRRDEKKGLSGTLEDLLNSISLVPEKNDGDSIHNPTNLGSGLSIAEKWRQREKEFNKGLVIIIDQVDEIYTSPQNHPDKELEAFCIDIREIFREPANYPEGKLVLGYRKEYHPDLDEAFTEYEIDRSPLFLTPLKRKDIIEVVTGLTSTQRLRNKYNLRVDYLLPEIIADDLLTDEHTSVAPVLQIILTRMWHITKRPTSPAREFTVKHYQELQKKGILIEDFFHQEMEKLRHLIPESVDSGLVLDVLKCHTTNLGTSCSRTTRELERIYCHRRHELEMIVKNLKLRYLLTDGPNNAHTNLAHDTLAPAIIKEYSSSDKPGQRAYRIITTKMQDFKNDRLKTKLDNRELDIVQQGKNGMRALEPDEKKLLHVSIQFKKQSEKARRRRIKAAFASVILILFTSVMAVWQWNDAKIIRKIAIKEKRKADANRLVIIANEKVNKDPTIALRVAEAAYHLDKNPLTTNTIYKIFRENSFYKTIINQGSVVNSVAFSPDGSKVLTGSNDNTARLMDIEGCAIMNFNGHKNSVNDIAFGPFGETILTGSGDNTAILWKFNGEIITNFKGHTGPVSSVAFAPDGNTILSGSGDRTARLWDLQGNVITEFKNHQAYVTSVAFSPDGNAVLTGSRDKIAYLWSLRGKILQVFEGHRSYITDVAFSPDGKVILTGSRDETARLWDRQSGKPIMNLTGHAHAIFSVAFSPDGNSILTGSWDNTARLWDRRGNMTALFTGHNTAVLSAAFSPDGKTIITGSGDRTVRLWDNRGISTSVFKGHSKGVASVTFSPDGSTILTGSYDMTARLWNRKEKSLTQLEGHKGRIQAVAFSPDGQIVLTGATDKTAILWDKGGNVINQLKGHYDGVTSVTFSPDGSSILTGSSDKTARLWNLDGNTVKEFKGHSHPIYSVAFSPDRLTVLTGSGDKTARLWNRYGKVLIVFKGHTGSVTSVAYSPDGNTILTGSKDNTARLYDRKGNLTKILRGHTHSVNSVSFSPDSNTILTGSNDYTTRLWDLSGNMISIFIGHTHSVHSAVFSPDGNSILTGSGSNYSNSHDNTARIWDIPMPLEKFLKEGKLQPLSKKQKKEFGIKGPISSL